MAAFEESCRHREHVGSSECDPKLNLAPDQKCAALCRLLISDRAWTFHLRLRGGTDNFGFRLGKRRPKGAELFEHGATMTASDHALASASLSFLCQSRHKLSLPYQSRARARVETEAPREVLHRIVNGVSIFTS